MGFLSKLWSGWGKSENVLPHKEEKNKPVIKKKVVKKKKKTTKKKEK